MNKPLNFMFRKPRFPIIVDTGISLVSCGTVSQATSRLQRKQFTDDGPYNVVDITGEGFSLYPEYMTITPLTEKKKWTKKELVLLCNIRKKSDSPDYVAGSLSNKKFGRVFTEIVDFIEERLSS